jgi:hypothetical protein
MRLIVASTLFILLISCNKHRLSRPTEKGEHVASWVSNGDAFRTNDKAVNGGPALVATYTSTGITGPRLGIVARVKDNQTNVITLLITNYTGPGIYYLKDNDNYGRVEYNSLSYDNRFTNKGYVQVTKHEEGKILAGVFEFIAGPTGEVTVSKGRFDLDLTR